MQQDYQDIYGQSGGGLQDYMGSFFGGDSSPQTSPTSSGQQSGIDFAGPYAGGATEGYTPPTSTAPTVARTQQPTTSEGADYTYQPPGPPAQVAGGTPPAGGGGGDLMGRITQALASARSTDDPNYWFQKISADPNGQGSAWGYWQDRINRGNGSQLGLPLFNDSNGGGGGGGIAQGGGQGGPATGFADPAYQQLLSLAQQRIGQLGQPQSFPQLDQYMQMLQQNQVSARQRAQTFADQMQGRIGQLQQPLMSQANVVQQQALASNNLLAQRDAMLANQRQKRFASGFEPTSGLLAGDERAINESYGNQQSNINAQLQQSNIKTDEQRRNEATQLQELVQQALQGGDTTALQSQAQVADLENQLFNIGQQQSNQQLSTAQIPVDLTNMGFSNASNAANAGGNPLMSMLSLLSLANGQQGLQQQNQNNNSQGLGWLLQALVGS